MLMEELKRRDSETEEEYENRIAEYRREMKEQEEEESQPLPKPPRPVIEERKRSFSDRQRRLEEKKLQQQKEEAERTRIEEEKRMKKDAKRRERKERERRESTQGQTLEEQDKNDYVSYYGPNFSVHPALTNSNPFSDNNDDKVVNKPPPPVIRQEYDAFSEGMTPERIIGATDELGELSFLVKWKGTDEADFVPAKKAKLHCPELVIRFYEGIIAWK